MPRTITVRGIGKVSTRPDYVVISMSLEAKNQDYLNAMELATFQLQHLTDCLVNIGFEKEAVKTTNFIVRTEYDRVKGEDGEYHRVFEGFVCDHTLKVEFDFDSKMLAKTLVAVAKSIAQPEFSIKFTVKDPSAVNEELLRNATINARKKAEILCDASGVSLGSLLSIDYNWGELNIVSRTQYVYENRNIVGDVAPSYMEFEPDDIDVSDTATFVWEIA